MSNVAHHLARRRDREEDGVGSNARAVAFNGQDFRSLKQESLGVGSLFCDPSFPAEPKSLGWDQLGRYSSKTRSVEWKRPTEICSNPQFIVEGASRTDICQGALGDCWLLAAIASLTLHKEILARVVPLGQSFQDDYAGIFHFQFWQYGEWVDVVIDDRLPTRDGELLFVHSAEGSEFWSALLEKAYAKVNGCYEALTGGSTIEGFEDFTGGIAEAYDLAKPPPYLYKIMQKALKRGSLLGCSIDITSVYDTEAKTRMNLVKGHAYSVTAAEEVHLYGSPVQLVRFRNPWGQVEWNGAWSDDIDETLNPIILEELVKMATQSVNSVKFGVTNELGCDIKEGSPWFASMAISREWDSVRAEEKSKLEHSAEDGEFWMSYSDFTQQFTRLEICNLTPDALTSDGVARWSHYQYEGNWRVGSTAGGCRNNPATFCSNPQFCLRLCEEDDDPHDGEDGCSFLVGLMQKDTRREKMFGRDLNTIGYAIYQVPDEYKGRSNVHLGPEVLLRQRSVAMSRTFSNVREMSDRFKLPPGEYVIIPSTFEPHRKGSFVLRIFSEKHAPTAPMEEDIDAKVDEPDAKEPEVSPVDVDPHFKQLFLKISGNDSEISAFELQQILNRVISQRTDVKTEGFCMETCRHIISLLDKDGTTKLGLVEFHTLWLKIQKYLEIFQNHDSDKSGTISSHELRGALTEAGFQMNSEVLHVMVQHYADAQFAIDFDCFVGCLIRLEMLFKMFKTLDKKNTGKIELDLFQWICLAMH